MKLVIMVVLAVVGMSSFSWSQDGAAVLQRSDGKIIAILTSGELSHSDNDDEVIALRTAIGLLVEHYGYKDVVEDISRMMEVLKQPKIGTQRVSYISLEKGVDSPFNVAWAITTSTGASDNVLSALRAIELGIQEYLKK